MTGSAGTRIDHVIFGVRDLDAAVLRFRSQFGLTVLARAEHPEWGTRNAVLPVRLGQFVELLAIADPDSDAPLVRGLKFMLRDGDRIVGTCLRPPNLDAVAVRLSLRIIPGERHEPDRVVRFRRTVPEERPDRPFFIEWDGAPELDERYAVAGGEIAWVEFGADPHELRDWIGDDAVPVRAVSGPPGPCRFAVRSSGGTELVIE